MDVRITKTSKDQKNSLKTHSNSVGKGNGTDPRLSHQQSSNQNILRLQKTLGNRQIQAIINNTLQDLQPSLQKHKFNEKDVEATNARETSAENINHSPVISTLSGVTARHTRPIILRKNEIDTIFQQAEKGRKYYLPFGFAEIGDGVDTSKIKRLAEGFGFVDYNKFSFAAAPTISISKENILALANLIWSAGDGNSAPEAVLIGGPDHQQNLEFMFDEYGGGIGGKNFFTPEQNERLAHGASNIPAGSVFDITEFHRQAVDQVKFLFESEWTKAGNDPFTSESRPISAGSARILGQIIDDFTITVSGDERVPDFIRDPAMLRTALEFAPVATSGVSSGSKLLLKGANRALRSDTARSLAFATMLRLSAPKVERMGLNGRLQVESISKTSSRTPVPGDADFTGPLTELDQKILFGATKPGTNKPIGGHSPDILNSNSFKMDAVRIVNTDGTISVTGVKKIIQRKDGNTGWSASKSPNIHTVAPPSWSNAKILDAGHQTAATPGVILRNTDGTKTTIHTKMIDGVEWQVIKDNGIITSSFPTGGKPIKP